MHRCTTSELLDSILLETQKRLGVKMIKDEVVRPGGACCAQRRGNSVAVTTEPQGRTLCVRVPVHEWALGSMLMMWRQRRAA